MHQKQIEQSKYKRWRIVFKNEFWMHQKKKKKKGKKKHNKYTNKHHYLK